MSEAKNAWERAHRAERSASKLARRHAHLGRVCRWCGRDDAACAFLTATECCTCARARERRRCPVCGGPLRLPTGLPSWLLELIGEAQDDGSFRVTTPRVVSWNLRRWLRRAGASARRVRGVTTVAWEGDLIERIGGHVVGCVLKERTGDH